MAYTKTSPKEAGFCVHPRGYLEREVNGAASYVTGGAPGRVDVVLGRGVGQGCRSDNNTKPWRRSGTVSACQWEMTSLRGARRRFWDFGLSSQRLKNPRNGSLTRGGAQPQAKHQASRVRPPGLSPQYLPLRQAVASCWHAARSRHDVMEGGEMPISSLAYADRSCASHQAAGAANCLMISTSPRAWPRRAGRRHGPACRRC